MFPEWGQIAPLGVIITKGAKGERIQKFWAILNLIQYILELQMKSKKKKEEVLGDILKKEFEKPCFIKMKKKY